MTDETQSLRPGDAARQERLEAVLADYLRRSEAGEVVDRQALLAAHPELADDLREFFANQAHLARLVNGPHNAPGTGGSSPPRPSRLRYFGDYEILDEIAQGGMGVVYKARQVSLNRIVAVKMILAGQLASAEDIKRFHSEAEAAAKLTHPAIVPVHEVGVHEGQHYFSMDYIDGRSLAQIVRESPLPARKAAECVRAIAEAVHYAHGQGTLHRDLKPSNVLIDGADRVRITDFGLAKRVEGESDLTLTGQVIGTPSYMPPEQAQGKRGQIGPAGDVYSLGAILYELLTGRPPFRAESSVETLRQVMEAEPVSPRLLNPRLPRDLETICLKCLRKEPGKRFPTAASLAEDLGRWLNNEPILARPVGRVEKAWLWCRRRPAIAGMIGAMLLTACIAIGFIVAERQRNLTKRVETAVTAIGAARGSAVPYAINSVSAFPDNLVRTTLREQFESATGGAKLPLCCALAHYGDVRVAFLVSRVEDVPPVELENLAAALGHASAESVATLEAAASTAQSREQWRWKARLAMLALRLGSPSLASEMCALRRDPVQRTWFIEECSTWHGDLFRLAELVSDIDDGPLRSAIALAAGSAPDADPDVTALRAWEHVLQDWYRNEPDALTHSVAGWTLWKWDLELPEIATPRQPVEHRDWQVNSVGMTMLLVPAGSFVRRDDRFPDDAVDQTVILTRPFLLADRHVTRAQFQEFIDDQDYPDAEKPPGWEGASIQFSPTRQHPVNRVNWYDAVLFCNWLSRREGLTPCYERTGERETIDGRELERWELNPDADGYRLVTEAEWEYTCRAGAETKFCHGDDESLLDRYAVYHADRSELPGSRLPNGWGFFDVHGNLYEWCHDWFGPFGNESTVADPTGPAGGDRRVSRGGSFLLDANLVRSAYRSVHVPDRRYVRNGFRVARSPAAGKNQLEAAIEAHRQATEREPTSAGAHWRLGGALRRAGELSEAIKVFQQAYELEPANEAYQTAFLETCLEAGEPERAIDAVRRRINSNPREWKGYYLLARLLRYTGDVSGYRDVCEMMFDEFSGSDDLTSRHALLSAVLCFPEGEVTPELLEVAREHGKSRATIYQRMLGLAYYRAGRDDEALTILERTAGANLRATSRVSSLLCLALVQLRLGQIESARDSIQIARTTAESTTRDDVPWDVHASLWREVQAAMAEAEIDEPIPELPPTYEEWAAKAAASTGE